MKGPWGVAVNQRGEIIVAENGAHCVSIFSPSGEKLRSFGSKGSLLIHFGITCGVAVDDEKVLVVDHTNHCIKTFTPYCIVVTTVGKSSRKPREFCYLMGIGIHPLNKKVYVTDRDNQCIQILNSDLTFSTEQIW